MLTVQRSRDKAGRERPLKGKLASDRRVVIPLPQDVFEAFEAHIDAMDVVPISGDLFATSNSTPLIYRNWRRLFWNRAVSLSGLVDVRPHDLRRTCVTRLFVVDRWTPAEVQAFVGHAKARTTLEIYAKVNSASLPVASAFESTIRGPQ